MGDVYDLLVAPDFSPSMALDWHLFASSLQKSLDHPVRLLLPNGRDEFHEKLANKPDLVYIGAFDAVHLIREQKYFALAKPAEHWDEVVILSQKGQVFNSVQDIPEDIQISCMSDADVERIALVLLEPCPVAQNTDKWLKRSYFQRVLCDVRDHDNCIGIVRKSIFDKLSSLAESWYEVVISSSLSELAHVLLVSPENKELRQRLLKVLPEWQETPQAQKIMKGLDFKSGLEMMDEESALFMCDIVDTLEV